MDFWFVLYIIVSIVIGLSLISMAYKREQFIAAMLIFALLTAVFVFFGLRWFAGRALKGTQPSTAAWPPIVNVCPDFMSSYTNNQTKKTYCYDHTNVYGLKTGGALPSAWAESILIGTDAGQRGIIIKNDSSSELRAITDLKADANKQRWPFLANVNADAASVWSLPDMKFVRWEGVWDGRTSTPQKAPLP